LKAEKAADKEEVGLPVNISAKVKTSAGAQLVLADIFHIDSFHNINLYQAENYIPTKKKNADQQIVRLPDDIDLAKVNEM
jgi:hypothetical protein